MYTDTEVYGIHLIIGFGVLWVSLFIDVGYFTFISYQAIKPQRLNKSGGHKFKTTTPKPCLLSHIHLKDFTCLAVYSLMNCLFTEHAFAYKCKELLFLL